MKNNPELLPLSVTDLTNAVNLADPQSPGMRIIGWRVPVEKAGLSDALFFLENLLQALNGLAEEGLTRTPTPVADGELEALGEALSMLERVEGKQIGIWKSPIHGDADFINGGYVTWNDGEYWVSKATNMLRNYLTTSGENL